MYIKRVKYVFSPGLEFVRVGPVRNSVESALTKFGWVDPGLNSDESAPTQILTYLSRVKFGRVSLKQKLVVYDELNPTYIWPYLVMWAPTKIRPNSIESVTTKIWPSWPWPKFVLLGW